MFLAVAMFTEYSVFIVSDESRSPEGLRTTMSGYIFIDPFFHFYARSILF